MSAPRFGRLHKATALVPLAILSTAWTVSLAGAGVTTVAAASDEAATLPDGTAVPTEAIEAPASVSLPGAVAPAVPKGQAGSAVSSASTSGIPSAAVAAYQRAETVINSADKSCNIPWQLIAAIGRVESDHGRYGGNVLNDQGVSTPGIYGIALDGSNNTQRILDTDAGQYDNDTKFDRAVGPMQFIPSTWSVVGVDGDNDGKRSPQDIDDAALATAVYLCSGNDDLSTDGGQRESVFRYNHSDDYVDLVLSIMQAYMDGEFTSVPNGTTSAGTFTPDPAVPFAQPARKGGGDDQGPRSGGGAPPFEDGSTDDGGGTGNVDSGGNDGGGETQPEEQPSPPVTPPEQPKDPVEKTTEQVEEKVREVVKDPGKTVEDVLTPLEARARCVAQGVVDNRLTGGNELQDCITERLG